MTGLAIAGALTGPTCGRAPNVFIGRIRFAFEYQSATSFGSRLANCSSVDFSDSLSSLEKQYHEIGAPIAANFRQLVPQLPYNARRFTHHLHSYPAKLIPQIPFYFIGSKSITGLSPTILDPFSGSGTVLLESCLAGHTAIGCDANPLARLLIRVKTTPQSPESLEKSITKLRDSIAATRTRTPPHVVNIEYWYSPAVIKGLARIASQVNRLPDVPFGRLAKIALSACARKLSFCDPRISVPVRLNLDRYPRSHQLYENTKTRLKWLRSCDPITVFFEILTNYANQVTTLWPIRKSLGKVEHIYENARLDSINSLSDRSNNTVDLIITSPPYLGAQKYIRSASLSLGWLRLADSSLTHLESLSIGREHHHKQEYKSLVSVGLDNVDSMLEVIHRENPLRAFIAATYLNEMRDVLKTCYRILKPSGKLVLVSGCNTLCGRPFETSSHLKTLCLNEGFNVRLELTDTIKSRGLMTRRNVTAGIIPTESVMLLQK